MNQTQRFLVPAAVVLLVFAAFGISLSQGFAPIDDYFLIYNNLAIRGVTFENLKTIFTTYDPELYIPLTLFTYQLNYMVGDLHPFVFHLTNLVLHAANALLVLLLAFQLTKNRWVAAMSGLVFAVHPLHTEAVVWIAGRKDLLSTMFFLLSFHFYLRYRSQARHAYSLSIIFSLYALLSKAMAVTLPAVLILYDVLLENRKIDRKMISDKLPFIALSGLFVIIALGGKERVVSSSTPLETILMTGKSSVFYLQKIFAPVRLSVFYPYNDAISAASPDFFLPWIFLIAIIVACFSRLNRLIAFGFLFYLITLAPTFLNFHKGAFRFFAVDRYAYIPSIGIIILALLLITMTVKRIQLIGAQWVTSIAIVGTLCVMSFYQTRLWNSTQTLFSHALALYPESLHARTDLARIYQENGQYEEAFELLKEGLAYGDDPHLYLAAGNIYAAVGQIGDAREQFEKAMALDPENPEPHFSLGSLEEQLGNVNLAQNYYEKAVELDPSFVVARAYLGDLYLENDRLDEAQQQFASALDWNPSSFEANASMGLLLLIQGDAGQALAYLENAYALRPYDPKVLVSLARHSIHQNNIEEAREYLNKALSMDQNHKEAHTLLNELE